MRAASYARVKDYGTTYQHEQCVIVQLESPKAIAAIEEIAAVDGIDALLSVPMTWPRAWDCSASRARPR